MIPLWKRTSQWNIDSPFGAGHSNPEIVFPPGHALEAESMRKPLCNPAFIDPDDAANAWRDDWAIGFQKKNHARAHLLPSRPERIPPKEGKLSQHPLRAKQKVSALEQVSWFQQH